MTDASVRQRTSSDVASWRRDGFVLVRQPVDADCIDQLVDLAEPMLRGGVDGCSDLGSDVAARLRSVGLANRPVRPSTATSLARLMDSLVETARRLTGYEAEVGVARVIDAGGDVVGLPAQQLVHQAQALELLATCAILASPDPNPRTVEMSPARHQDLLISDEGGLLPQSAERALAWRPLELSFAHPLWIHPLAPVRIGHGAGTSSARLVLLHLIRAVTPPTPQDAATTSRAEPAPIMSLAPTNAAAVADAIVQLYDSRGSTPYQQGVDHASHALQAGAHAMAAGASVSMIVAAFLHDIGLLIGADPRGPTRSAGSGSMCTGTDHDASFDHDASSDHDASFDHGVRGAELLERWFTSGVTQPIRLHVTAQRYLAAAAADLEAPSSFDRAAQRSRTDLSGEPMSVAEMLAFEAADGWLDALRLRHWDAAAIEPGAPTPSLDTFRTLIESIAVVERAPR
jgi:[1-hydroxy-2-(trimethylamino)ethyl]phosphonate dioxygenase